MLFFRVLLNGGFLRVLLFCNRLDPNIFGISESDETEALIELNKHLDELYKNQSGDQRCVCLSKNALELKISIVREFCSSFLVCFFVSFINSKFLRKLNV